MPPTASPSCPVPRGVVELESGIPASKLTDCQVRVVGETAPGQARRSSEDNGKDTECLDLGDREGFPARSGLKASRRSLVAMSQAGGVTGAQSEPERHSSGEELRDEQVPSRGRRAGWGGPSIKEPYIGGSLRPPAQPPLSPGFALDLSG